MTIKSQLLKGVLDGCVLSIIEEEAVYGYTLSQKLHASGLTDISEGTIYPVLLRLQKNGLIEGEMRPSDSGPNRKYYSLTPAGRDALQLITAEWKQMSNSVNGILLRRDFQ